MTYPGPQKLKIMVFVQSPTQESVPQSDVSWEEAFGAECFSYHRIRRQIKLFNPVDVAR